jgi:hypothetical protein
MSDAADPSTTRVTRARRRRQRRRVGVALFALVAAVVLTIAFLAVDHSGDEKDAASRPRRPSTTTTVPLVPPAGPYKVTDGINVRSGPGTAYSIVGTIELGNEVMVVCTVEGEAVNGPSGPTTKWVRITSASVGGYVTAQYVAIGPAIDDRAVVALCPSI